MLSAAAAPASGGQAVFLVRHAERADAAVMSAPAMSADPELSAAGKERATHLASIMKDAQITAIYTTEFKRTQQTAEPLAKALQIQPSIIAARDTATLIEKLKAATGNVLVIAHSNTLGDAIAALGVTETVKVGDNDYDNLFIVTRGEKPTLVRLHYR